jgi:hypothetical protein
MSFFGLSVDAITRFTAFCNKKLILIVHAKPQRHDSVNAISLRPKPLGPEEVLRCLTERGQAFRRLDAVIEFGQPFTSLAEAREFSQVYAETSKAAGGRDPRDIERRLVETGRSDYPLYLPKPKELAVFALTKDPSPRRA